MRLAPCLCAALLAGCGGGGSLDPVAFLLEANLEPGGVTALYGYDAQGLLVRRVSGPLGAGWGTNDFRVSPDHRWVVFTEDKATFDREQAFLVDLEGLGDPIPLTSLPASPDTVSVSLGAWSPDSTRVLVHGNLDGGTDWGLYVVPVAGGTPILLSTPGMKLPSSVTYWSPDGALVTWMEGPSNNGPWVQRVGHADGSGSVSVSGAMVAGGGVRLMQGNNPWASDGSRLVFVADKEVDEKFELFGVDPDGSALAKLSPALGANADVADYECSRVGALIAFKTTVGNYDLQVMPVDGSLLPVPLSSPSESVGEFHWIPGGTRIAWSSYDFDDSLRHLRSREASSGSTQELYTGLPGEDLAAIWRWAPEGGRIAFRVGDEDVMQDHMRLLTVAGDGSSAAVDVLPGVTPTGDVLEYGWTWSPDGSRLLVTASETDVAIADLYLVWADGSAAWQLSQVSAEQEGIGGMAFSLDGTATAWLEGWSEPHVQLHVGGGLGGGGTVAEWGGPGQEMDVLAPR
jgi:Tol biopolymer transport system component